MKFSFVEHLSEDLSNRSQIIIEFSTELEEFFKLRYYGSSIETFLIGLTCVRPEFEQFFKPRKPEYIEEKVETHDGISVKIVKSFSYDLKLDYKLFKEAEVKEIRKIVAKKVLISLSELVLPKKAQDFDKELFELDLMSYFQKRNIIGLKDMT